jgi:hypothetical protein
MRPAHVSLCAAVLAAAVLSSPAEAGGSFADREAARTLSGKAYEEFEARHYRRAIELFQQAEARFHAPPHLLYTARAQVKLGLFVEAKAVLERVVAEKLPSDAPAPFRDAQVSARSELGEVETLTPRLVVTLPEPPPPGARVLLDGEPLSPADLGRPLPANPGTHAIVFEAPGAPRVERNAVLTTGGGDERVDLSQAPPVISRSVVPVVVAFSVGAAGLIAGTAGALLLLKAPASHTTALRVTEVAGYTIGGLGVGAGIVFAVLRSRPAATVSRSPSAPGRWTASATPSAGPVRAQVSVGPGSLTLGGTF